MKFDQKIYRNFDSWETNKTKFSTKSLDRSNFKRERIVNIFLKNWNHFL